MKIALRIVIALIVIAAAAYFIIRLGSPEDLSGVDAPDTTRPTDAEPAVDIDDSGSIGSDEDIETLDNPAADPNTPLDRDEPLVGEDEREPIVPREDDVIEGPENEGIDEDIDNARPD